MYKGSLKTDIDVTMDFKKEIVSEFIIRAGDLDETAVSLVMRVRVTVTVIDVFPCFQLMM